MKSGILLGFAVGLTVASVLTSDLASATLAKLDVLDVP
jgi:hypothetical protein